MRKGPTTMLLLTLLQASAIAQTGVQRLAWLQGCWAAVGNDGVVEEQWMAPRGKAMIGSSRTAGKDELLGYEFVIVREQGDRLAYEVRPSGKAAVVFVSSTVTDSSVVFENPKNEFPQRVGYQRNGQNAVLAWIEGTRRGASQRVEFPYRQVVCAGG
ncbi:DUF6265 family protein [soil metagenome]